MKEFSLANRSVINKFDAEKAALLDGLSLYHRRWNKKLVEDAFDFAIEAHHGQFRHSGEEFVTHPIAVAGILVELKTDHVAVAASLLHDVVEDNVGITQEEIEQKFGEEIGLLVDGVTKITGIKFKTYQDRQAETLRKMLLSMLKDLRVILIKLADRLHNMRTISSLTVRSQQRIATETREVYIPLAYRLGIAKVAREMEDHVLKVLDNAAYKKILSLITGTKDEREAIIEEIIDPIVREMKRYDIKAEAKGRVKSVASIYNKMLIRGKSVDEIYDLIAIRIIVSQKSECYRVLGMIHDIFTPVTDHFRDYIALPKSNLYQSLHTKVKDHQNRIVEIQIRSTEMHNIAEIGIAAHWRYKEGYLQPDSLDDHFAWIRSLMEAHQESAESGEFIESLKVDLFQDEIYVFTPGGKLIQLPTGATPIDFAFAIHSEVGYHAIAAKIKGQIVSMNHPIESGDIVKILTSEKQSPNIEWLKSVRTSKARSLIKKWFRETQWEQSKILGEEIIVSELKRLKLPHKSEILEEVALSFGHNLLSDFYASVGSGQLPIGRIMRKLMPMITTGKDALISRIIQKIDLGKQRVRVSGLDNLVISIADCCNPLPGDPIIGFQTKGKGLDVHRNDCHNVPALLEDETKIIRVAWDVEREDRFAVQIYIVADDRLDMLHDITRAISWAKVGLTKIEMHMEESLAVGSLVAKVKNLPHLTRLIGRINRIKGVLKVERKDMSDPQVSINEEYPSLKNE